jgi:hypothetical protein
MVIEEKDFRMTQISQSSPFWDLELLKTIRPKGGVVRQEFTNVGYGMTLGHCLKSIVNFRLSNKHLEDVVSMKQYLKEYIAEIKEIKSYIDEAILEDQKIEDGAE